MIQAAEEKYAREGLLAGRAGAARLAGDEN